MLNGFYQKYHSPSFQPWYLFVKFSGLQSQQDLVHLLDQELGNKYGLQDHDNEDQNPSIKESHFQKQGILAIHL